VKPDILLIADMLNEYADSLVRAGEDAGGFSIDALRCQAELLEASEGGAITLDRNAWRTVKTDPTEAMAKTFLRVYKAKGFRAAWKATCTVSPEPT
jgi:hypothetical protein